MRNPHLHAASRCLHLLVGACSGADIVEADPPLEATNGKGWFTVWSTTFDGGTLDLTFGSQIQVMANLHADSTVWQSSAKWQGTAVSSDLQRVAK